MAKVIIDAAKALDITVHDHIIIIGENGHVSLKELKDLKSTIRLNRQL